MYKFILGGCQRSKLSLQRNWNVRWRSNIFLRVWVLQKRLLSYTPTGTERPPFPYHGNEEGRGGYLTKFNTGRLRPEVQPLTISYTILAEKVPLLYTFHWKKEPLSHTYYRTSCPHFHVWPISLPFYIPQLVKSLPFHIPEAWKRYPFRAEPSRIGHYREYPPPPPGEEVPCSSTRLSLLKPIDVRWISFL